MMVTCTPLFFTRDPPNISREFVGVLVTTKVERMFTRCLIRPLLSNRYHPNICKYVYCFLSTNHCFHSEKNGNLREETTIWDPDDPYGPSVSVTQMKLLRDKKTLQLQFKICGTEQTVHCSLSAELLRVESPSAESYTVNHNGLQVKKLISGKKFVTIAGIEPVGNYGVRIVFSDEHCTGIYTWRYLYRMCTRKYTLMKQYIQALKQSGKSRYPLSYLRKLKEDKKQEQNIENEQSSIA
jgi:DUF971 family protein